MNSLERPGQDNEKIKQVISMMPTELRCIDESVDGTSISENDLILKKLEPKVEAQLQAMIGGAIPVGEGATKEEMLKYAELLESKAENYSKVAAAIKEISE